MHQTELLMRFRSCNMNQTELLMRIRCCNIKSWIRHINASSSSLNANNNIPSSGTLRRHLLHHKWQGMISCLPSSSPHKSNNGLAHLYKYPQFLINLCKCYCTVTCSHAYSVSLVVNPISLCTHLPHQFRELNDILFFWCKWLSLIFGTSQQYLMMLSDKSMGLPSALHSAMRFAVICHSRVRLSEAVINFRCLFTRKQSFIFWSPRGQKFSL